MKEQKIIAFSKKRFTDSQMEFLRKFNVVPTEFPGVNDVTEKIAGLSVNTSSEQLKNVVGETIDIIKAAMQAGIRKFYFDSGVPIFYYALGASLTRVIDKQIQIAFPNVVDGKLIMAVFKQDSCTSV